MMDTAARAKQFAPFDALKGHSEAVGKKETNDIIYDESTQEAVSVIASFGNKGGMIPVYFMVEGVKLKINKVLWQSNDKVWGNQYRCEATVNDRVWTVDLFYYSTHRLWTMKKL